MTEITIEKLQTQVDDIKSSLVSLQKETSGEIKKTKTENISQEVETIKRLINTKLEELKKLGEETNKLDIEKLKDMLASIENYSVAIENLKKEIEEKENPNRRKYTPTAAGGMAAGGAAGWGAGEVLKKKFAAERISETANVAKTRKNMNSVVKMLEIRLKDSELLDVQKENIRKSITYFEEARDNAHAMGAVEVRKKLGDKLPIEVLQKLDITPAIAKQLEMIEADQDLIKAIVNSQDDLEIKNLLKAKNINDIPDEVVKLLRLADKADDIADIAKVLRVARPIKALGRGLRMIPWLDILAAGVDVRVYFSEAREAELIKKINELRGINKQQQANFHLAAAAVDLAIGITAFAITCGSSGPPGWIVGVVAAVAAGVVYGVRSVADAYYYEVVDFYMRNKEDYKSLYRVEIKQAILSATIRGDDSFPLSGSEVFTEIFNRSDSVDENKTVTLEDAYRAMIYLEEKDDYPTVVTLNPNYPKDPETPLAGKDLELYTKEKEELDTIMELRMEYIKKFLPHTTTSNDKDLYDTYISDIHGAAGINAIEQIVADSKVYQKMKQDKDIEGYTDIKKYQEAQAAFIKKYNEERFESLEKLYADDPSRIVELYYNVVNYEFIVKDIESYSDTYTELLPKIAFIKQYYEYRFASVTPEKKVLIGGISDISYIKVEEMLKSEELDMLLLPTNFDEQQIKGRVVGGLDLDRFEESYVEYTTSIGQNVVYRIAKEIYGYTGKNNLLDMIVYFSPEKNESLGMYYNDGWYVNIVNGSDNELTFLDIENKSVDEIMEEYIQHNADDNLDTPVENIDTEMNLEFKNRVRKILEEEKAFQTQEKKQEIKDEIVEYIKTYGVEGYVKLPYYLVNDAKRAGLGNVEYFYYIYQNEVITACTSKAYVDEKIDLGTEIIIKKSYVENVREKFSEDEQKYIDYVENAHDRLMEIRKEAGTRTQEDELDLPEEFEKTIGDKAKERQNFKSSLLAYDPEITRKQLLENYEQYHMYFENLYMGILIELSSHSFSNDIDGYEYLLSVLSNMQSGFFDFENKKLLEGVLSEKETEMFYKITANKKVFGKTIDELVASEDEEEKKKGYRAAKEVLKSILEAKTLQMNSKFEVEDIYSGECVINPVIGIPESVSRISGMRSLPELIKHNLDESNYMSGDDDIDITKISSKTSEEISIKELTASEQKTYDISTDVLKEIEDTAENVVWQDQRGNITFDPEKKTIESRGSKVKIDIERLKVSGLDIVFPDIKELLYMANLLNRIKGKFLKENPSSKGIFFLGSKTGTLYVNDGYINDTDVVSEDAIAAKYPSLKSESNQTVFTNYVNKL